MWRLWAAALLAACTAPPVAADDTSLDAAEIYEGACASCHGTEGRGAPEGTAITVPLPDFSDCNFVTREADGNWRYLLAHGGDGLGLSSQMPAFGGVLSAEQQQAALDYIRTFCRDARFAPRRDRRCHCGRIGSSFGSPAIRVMHPITSRYPPTA